MAAEPRHHRIYRLGLQVADHLRAAHPDVLTLPWQRRDAMVREAARAACGSTAKRDGLWVYCAVWQVLVLGQQIRLDEEQREHDRAQRRGLDAAPAPADPAPPTLPFGDG